MPFGLSFLFLKERALSSQINAKYFSQKINEFYASATVKGLCKRHLIKFYLWDSTELNYTMILHTPVLFINIVYK